MKTAAPASPLQLSISPTTVYYNAGQGTQDTVDFIMTIANTGTDAVQISRAAILLPANLYAAGSLNSIAPVAPSSLWNFTGADSPGVFEALPAKGGAIALNAGSSISFSLQSVTLAASTLTTQVSIKVVLDDGTPVEQTPSVSLEPGQPGINFFFPEPANINPGQTSTLNWETTGIEYCIIAPGDIRVGASGSLQLSPEAPITTYTLTAYTAGTNVTQQATISVGTPSIIQFGVEGPTAVDYGSYITLLWECSAFTQSVELISIDNGDLAIPGNLLPGPGQISTVIGPINKETTFQLTPYGYGNESYTSGSVSVIVNPPTATFAATPESDVWEQDTVTINWQITNAASVSVAPALPGGPSLQNLYGSAVINPAETISYTLTVTGAPISGQSLPQTITIPLPITVSQVAINSFLIKPGSLIPGESRNEATLLWDTQAQVVQINNGIGIVTSPDHGHVLVPSLADNTTYTLTAGTIQNPVIQKITSNTISNSFGPYSFNAFPVMINNWGEDRLYPYAFTILNPGNFANLDVLSNTSYTIELSGMEIEGGIPPDTQLIGFISSNALPLDPCFYVLLSNWQGISANLEWTNPSVTEGSITITGLYTGY